jgi:hypothetical protein
MESPAVQSKAKVDEPRSLGRQHTRGLKGAPERLPVVSEQGPFEGLTSLNGERRLPHRWFVTLALGDVGHGNVVHRRQRIGLAVRIASPLLEPTTGIPPKLAIVLRRRHCSLPA